VTVDLGQPHTSCEKNSPRQNNHANVDLWSYDEGAADEQRTYEGRVKQRALQKTCRSKVNKSKAISPPRSPGFGYCEGFRHVHIAR
jgi:hypothetical protein